MEASNARVTSIVNRVAMLVALAVAIALPAGYWIVAFDDFAGALEFKARVKATAISGLVTANPDVWKFAENRLIGLLTREPVPLLAEAVQIFDENGVLVAGAGAAPRPPVLRRAFPLYDAARLAGRVEVSDSLRGVIEGTLIAALLGILLGSSVFGVLRALPLRALRRVTDALFAQKERAEVTLRSIGDAVITTDAEGRIDFMNPTAESLSGWKFADARGRHVEEVLRFLLTENGTPAPTPLRQALAENRAVSVGSDVDLLRRDGSRLGIDDSAAPMCGRDGRITGGVLVFRDVSEERNRARKRTWESEHDVLTGLANRRQFETLVEAALASAHDAGKHHVVCYMDLDRFKVVNDTCGHAAGDELLKELSALLLSRIRESDTLARLGGDEFGLLLESCSQERAQLIAADLLAGVQDYRFVWESKVFSVGVSIGLAVADAASVGTADVMNRADTACYWAKDQGRNRVCVYRTGDSEMAERRREVGWIARINAALDDNRFTLYHQTYLELDGAAGGRQHLEVLLRMIDEEGKLILPGSFLPAAERYNLMPAIDRWVVHTVFAGYRALAAERGNRPLTCAINLSGTTLNAEGFLDFVRQCAEEHALPPHSICFEITETAAINNLRNAAEFIRECKALGFLFALDDFGTGTSSFGYLKSLDVDYLKIDGGFVKNIENDKVDRAMTETINQIGHIMGIKTVAEYAESDSIIAELRGMGVDYAQGYGVCKPTPLFGNAVLLAPANNRAEKLAA